MEPKYPLLLLDADGTLFDFARAEREAFFLTCTQFGLPCSEDIYRLYSNINDAYWMALGRGEITKGELVIRRFEDLLRELSATGNPHRVNARYRKNLGEGWYLLPQAEEVCKILSEHCRLVIATNGVEPTQQRRLALSPIAPYISALISSDRAKADKPDPRFFEFLFREIAVTDWSNTLMVGDMLGTDIRGGIDFGLDTCWISPEGDIPPDDCMPTYHIHALGKLPDIAFYGKAN